MAQRNNEQHPPTIAGGASTSQPRDDDLDTAQVVVTQLVSAAIAAVIPQIQEGILAAVDARMTGTLQDQRQALDQLGKAGEGQGSVDNSVLGTNPSPAATSAPSLTIGGMPNASLIANVPIFSTASNSSSVTVTSQSGATLLSNTLLQVLLPPGSSELEDSTGAVLIGSCSPPIPRKMAEKAW